ncbi:MAG: hypothetical protein JWO85_2648 [Candidatus Eremiobacteraeota bacterium]|nr:hypothetical protein [Candidatus Eremiobacteraeota bacterium]
MQNPTQQNRNRRALEVARLKAAAAVYRAIGANIAHLADPSLAPVPNAEQAVKDAMRAHDEACAALLTGRPGPFVCPDSIDGLLALVTPDDDEQGDDEDEEDDEDEGDEYA